jgi:hypothetical protein
MHDSNRRRGRRRQFEDKMHDSNRIRGRRRQFEDN